jgi:hypothetical protein
MAGSLPADSVPLDMLDAFVASVAQEAATPDNAAQFKV